MPWCDTDAMAAHLIEISAAVDPGAQAVLIVDQAGWHLTPKLAIPDNITVLALPPRSPDPVENVWQFMRDNWLSNRIFKSYEDIVALCCQAWNNFHRRNHGRHPARSRAPQMGVMGSDRVKGFVVQPRRWVVERTIAWLNRCRRLAKDWENLNRNALAFIKLASIRLMLRKLCNPT